MSDPLARQIAADLLAIGAVTLAPEAPFTWASGLRAPIYCDNRLTMAHPRIRERLTDGFQAILERHALYPQVLVGTATAGIPHAAWLAHRLDLPMAYARSKPKEHGRGNRIEGRLDPGQHAVVVEDLISTGGSSLAAVEAVRAAGVRVEALVAIFSYGLPGTAERFADAGVPCHTLTTFDTLLAVAADEHRLPPDALDSLRAWQHDPRSWSDRVAG